MAADADAKIVTCAACGSQLKVKGDERRGHGKCPKCGKPVVFSASSPGAGAEDKAVLATLQVPDPGPRGPQPLALVKIAGAAKPGTQPAEGERVTIGRDPANSICIPDSRASKRHAEIVASKDSFVLRDLKSTNGTSLNDGPVSEEELVAGDLIGLGGALLLAVKPETPGGFAGLTVAKRADGLEAYGTLIGLSGPADGSIYPLGRGPITIGSAPGVAVRLEDADVSDFHAQIANTPNGPRIVDLGSRSRVIVDEKAVETHLLHDGDVIAIGAARFRFEAASAIDEPEDAAPEGGQSRRDNVTPSAVQRSKAPTKPLLALQSKTALILRCIEGKDKDCEWEIVGPRTTLGRGSEANIVLADPVASRVHAAITVDSKGVTVADLKSRNGILVNGKKIESARIKPGDKLGVGGTVLLVQDPKP